MFTYIKNVVIIYISVQEYKVSIITKKNIHLFGINFIKNTTTLSNRFFHFLLGFLFLIKIKNKWETVFFCARVFASLIKVIIQHPLALLLRY